MQVILISLADQDIFPQKFHTFSTITKELNYEKDYFNFHYTIIGDSSDVK